MIDTGKIRSSQHSIRNIVPETMWKRGLPALQREDETDQGDQTNHQSQRDIGATQLFTQSAGPGQSDFVNRQPQRSVSAKRKKVHTFDF